MKDIAKQIVQKIVATITAETTKTVRKDLCDKWEAIINKELEPYKARTEQQVDALCRVLVAAALLPNETSSGLQPIEAWRNWAQFKPTI